MRTAKTDQTGQMPRLIRVFAGCTLILLVLSWVGSFMILTVMDTGKIAVIILKQCGYIDWVISKIWTIWLYKVHVMPASNVSKKCRFWSDWYGKLWLFRPWSDSYGKQRLCRPWSDCYSKPDCQDSYQMLLKRKHARVHRKYAWVREHCPELTGLTFSDVFPI